MTAVIAGSYVLGKGYLSGSVGFALGLFGMAIAIYDYEKMARVAENYVQETLEEGDV